MATRQVFDDGTWVDYDDAGNPVKYADTGGNVYGPDTNVAKQYLSTLAGLGIQAIQRAINPQPAPAASSAPAQPTGSPVNLGALALLGVGGWLLTKLLK
jgi:hypothetical protein